jgi:uncharacterized protein (TIGR04255 family)
VSPGQESLKFSTPPVRTVVLTVYFEALETLQPIHLSALREQWRSSYPSIGSLAPLRAHPHAGSGSAAREDIPSWPFPYMIFGTADESEAVAIQNDRLIRTWTFSEGASYPGYEKLSGDLKVRLDEFAVVVKEELDRELTLTSSDCRYANEITDISIADLLVGVASSWQGDAKGATLDNVHYAGLRLHIDNPDDAASHVYVDVDTDDGDGATLEITSRYETVKTDADDDAALGGLDRAHDALLSAFRRFTSEPMKMGWGQEQ